jgi:hypothetical protein
MKWERDRFLGQNRNSDTSPPKRMCQVYVPEWRRKNVNHEGRTKVSEKYYPCQIKLLSPYFLLTFSLVEKVTKRIALLFVP